MRKICRTTAIALALAWLAGFAVIAAPQRAEAGQAAAIDAAVDETLREFSWQVRGGAELVRKAVGILVFPKVYKAGFGIGGEFGEGALRRRGKTEDYYNTISASFGFQLGAQTRSVIIAFMTLDALYAFQRVDGWKVGVDGSVAILSVGLGASIDTTRIVDPITAFIFDGKGLMYNLTLEGSKISRITPR
jgi:lipid-binding SYLF domain-containing protein